MNRRLQNNRDELSIFFPPSQGNQRSNVYQVQHRMAIRGIYPKQQINLMVVAN